MELSPYCHKNITPDYTSDPLVMILLSFHWIIKALMMVRAIEYGIIIICNNIGDWGFTQL